MSDEQLVATNEELVKRLRPLSWSDIDARFGVPMDKTMREAADRIELLATTNEQLVATNEALTAELATCEKYRDAYAECDKIGTQAVRDLETKLAELTRERDELRAAIFGSPDYAPDLRNGNFREMAETLIAAMQGGKARAEAAEATVATLTAQGDVVAKWRRAFAAQSRKLQAVLHIPGVKEELAALTKENHNG